MAKYDAYSRRELRALRRAWARNHVGLLATGLVLTAGLVSITTVLLLMMWPSSSWRTYALGGSHVAIVAAVAHVFNSSFYLQERKAIVHLRGATGEENTREELKRAKRKKIIWGWVDSIDLANGDIDHLVVTRAGGVLALDSKWRSHDTLDPSAMTTSAKRVRLRAQAVTSSVLKAERGSHRARSASATITPAVVLWGSSQRAVPADANIDGIRFVAGRQLIKWLRTLDGETIDRDAADDLIERLETFRATSGNASNSG